MFLVKVTSKATPDNENFAGETQVWLFGKGQRNVQARYNEDPIPYFVHEYGFKTKAAAARAAKAHEDIERWAERSGFKWTSKVEVVEV